MLVVILHDVVLVLLGLWVPIAVALEVLQVGVVVVQCFLGRRGVRRRRSVWWCFWLASST